MIKMSKIRKAHANIERLKFFLKQKSQAIDPTHH
jgi:hypothetical protein